MAEVDEIVVRWCVVAAIRRAGGQKPPAHDPVRIDKYLNETLIKEMLGDVGSGVVWGRREVVKNTDRCLHDTGMTSGPNPVKIAKVGWLEKEYEDEPVMTYADNVRKGVKD